MFQAGGCVAEIRGQNQPRAGAERYAQTMGLHGQVDRQQAERRHFVVIPEVGGNSQLFRICSQSRGNESHDIRSVSVKKDVKKHKSLRMMELYTIYIAERKLKLPNFLNINRTFLVEYIRRKQTTS